MTALCYVEWNTGGLWEICACLHINWRNYEQEISTKWIGNIGRMVHLMYKYISRYIYSQLWVREMSI